MTVPTTTELLSGRTAFITGGAQGLGLAMAQTFVRHGARVVIADLDADRARHAASSLSPACLGLGCDVSVDDAVADALRDAAAHLDGLDIVVNNAGFTRDSTMRKMTVDDFDAVVGVHLRGSWLGTKHASAIMRERGIAGSIINMSSISGKVGNAGQTNYSAAKAGIVGLTKAAAKELGFAGIRVNAIQPGIIETDMTRAMAPEILEKRLADIPLGRFGTPDEVANVALFLASDMSSYLTGTVIEISGGRHI